MTEYWGLEAICQRMNWKDRRTPVREMVNHAFLMYKRRRGKHPRRLWYTHEGMIGTWEIVMCQHHREQLIGRLKAQKKSHE